MADYVSRFRSWSNAEHRQGCPSCRPDTRCREEHREARSDCHPVTIENRLTGSLLRAQELFELVDLRTDPFLGP